MTRKLGIAIVGLHNWYHAYPFASAIKEMPDLSLVAVSHDVRAQLKQFAETYGIKEISSDMMETGCKERCRHSCPYFLYSFSFEASRKSM